MTLSNVQLEIFDGWRRPHEALPPPKLQEPNVPAEGSPTMINGKNVDLVQDVNTDCSVVASLCAGTARASHGHSKVDLPRVVNLLSFNIILDRFIHLPPL